MCDWTLIIVSSVHLCPVFRVRRGDVRLAPLLPTQALSGPGLATRNGEGHRATAGWGRCRSPPWRSFPKPTGVLRVHRHCFSGDPGPWSAGRRCTGFSPPVALVSSPHHSLLAAAARAAGALPANACGVGLISHSGTFCWMKATGGPWAIKTLNKLDGVIQSRAIIIKWRRVRPHSGGRSLLGIILFWVDNLLFFPSRLTCFFQITPLSPDCALIFCFVVVAVAAATATVVVRFYPFSLMRPIVELQHGCSC